MAWAKIDDSMPHHPKIVSAGPLAFCFDVASICYSNRFGLNGRVASSLLHAIFPGFPDPEAAAERLVEVGRWERTEGGYLIHDIHEYQPSAEKSADLGRKRSESGRKGGLKSGETRRAKKGDEETKPEAKSKQVASPGLEANTNPVPSRPVPSLSSVSRQDLFKRAVDNATDRMVELFPPSANPAKHRQSIEHSIHERCGEWLQRTITASPNASASALGADIVREMT